MSFILDDLRLTVLNENEVRGEYKIGPLHKGYGTTIGNALRRTLLSSIPGIAVTAVHLEGIHHQFTAIPYILEDAIQLVANIKKLVFKGDFKGKKVVSLNARGKREVKASDLSCPDGIEIVNKDFTLAHLVDSNAKFNIELYIEKNFGYRFSEENRDSSYPIGTFPIDSNFSPVTHVSMNIKQVMFGESLNYETLLFTVETNGSIAPMSALKASTDILIEYFSNILVQKEPKEEIIEEEYIPEAVDILKKPLEEIVPLSVRTGNVFKKAGIYTVGDLFGKSKKELLSLKNFGIKSLIGTIDELMKIPEIEKLKNRNDLTLITEINNGELILEEAEIEAEEAAEELSKEATIAQEETIKEGAVAVNILNKSIDDLGAEIGLPNSQIDKLKKLQIETVEHLTHMRREDLLIGSYKLSKKNVDKIEEYLLQNSLRFKD
jgi:DNA-directed RNA polymerase subunit alpha